MEKAEIESRCGKQAWSHVLLTSGGWVKDMEGGVKENIRRRFGEMLDKPAREARVLFIPTAAIDDEAKRMVGKCRDELLNAGILPDRIDVYDMDGNLCAEAALEYDVLYFTGGDTAHLLRRIRETGFDDIIKKMVYADKVYVGASAGSIIATPNIGDPHDPTTAGLSLVQAYLSVHQPEGTPPRMHLGLPHIPLTDRQALAVSWDGYEIVED